jgi:hypothetical protein
MKKYFKYSVLIVSSYTIFVVFSSNSSGSPGGYTGSPLDGKTCGTNGGCHNTPANERDLISTNIPENGIENNTTYEVSISPSEEGIDKYGFEFMAVDENNQGVGLISDNATINVRGNGLRATHNVSSTSGSGGTTWTFEWTSPESLNGEILFYVASLAANNDGGTSGDKLLVSNASFTTAVVSSNIIEKQPLAVYPNPASSQISIMSDGPFVDFSINVLSVNGTVVLESENMSTIDISVLPAGMYFLQLIPKDNKNIYFSNFIKI